MGATDTFKKILGPAKQLDRAGASVTIRYARPDDALELLELADLDSSRPPHGVVLVAEVGGQLWAAHSLEDGHAIADPFRPSGELSYLLAERAQQIMRSMPEPPARRPRPRTLSAA